MSIISFKMRLFLSFLILLVCSICIPSYYMHKSLKNLIYLEAEENAFRQLNFVEWLLSNHQKPDNDESLNVWITELSQHAKFRITIIAYGGKVVADSNVLYEKLDSMDNHASREEVKLARLNKQGFSIRYSGTSKIKLIYAAKQTQIERFPNAILRVSIPISETESKLQSFVRLIYLILGGALIMAVLITYMEAQFLESPIKKMLDTIKSLEQGYYSWRVRIDDNRELEELALAINRMAVRIENDMRTITAQKRELEAVLEGMKEGVMLIEPSGKIRTINKALSQIVLCTPPYQGYLPIEAFLNTDFQKACETVRIEKENISLEILFNGSYFEINIMGIDYGGAVAVFHDVTKQHQLEKTRQDFVANVSHELRTPLTAITGFAETLLHENMKLDQEPKEYVEVILQKAKYMTNIVSDLLELTRFQSQGQKFSLSYINLSQCVSAAWETCLTQAKQKQIELNNEIDPELTVIAENRALIQVFTNLIDNAIYYSKQKDEHIKVTKIRIFAKTEDEQIIVGVEDEGPGIPSKYHERIFERFFRVDKDRSKAQGRTGLGLSICKHAMKQMGGQIWVKSPPDNKPIGSVFYISLKRVNT